MNKSTTKCCFFVWQVLMSNIIIIRYFLELNIFLLAQNVAQGSASHSTFENYKPQVSQQSETEVLCKDNEVL